MSCSEAVTAKIVISNSFILRLRKTVDVIFLYLNLFSAKFSDSDRQQMTVRNKAVFKDEAEMADDRRNKNNNHDALLCTTLAE